MKSILTTVCLVNERMLVAQLPRGRKIEDEDPESLARQLYALGILVENVRCPSWRSFKSPTAAQKAKLFCTLRILQVNAH